MSYPLTGKKFFKKRIEYLNQKIKNGCVYPSEVKVKPIKKF